MADDADITKLPLEDRLVHKVNSFAPWSLNFQYFGNGKKYSAHAKIIFFYNLGMEGEVKWVRRVGKNL